MPVDLDFASYLEPVSELSPCGDDLELAGDGDYFNYTIPADSRLPTQYLDVTGKIVYDRSSINLDEETSQIRQLLDRSRDLRLLALLAQFGAATLSLDTFAAALVSMRELLDRHWDHVHPVGEDGDFTMRKVALEAVDDRVRVAIPLSFAPLVRGKNAGIVTCRAIELAQHPELKREVEQPLQMTAVIEAFAEADNLAAAGHAIETVRKSMEALKGIRAIFLDKADFDQLPAFPNTLKALEDIEAAIRQASPALAQGEGPADEPAPAPVDARYGEAKPAESGLVAPATPSIPVEGPASHGEAIAMLEDIEAYFATKEPSSPALLLVHQARRLVGRPLIEALEALAGPQMETMRIGLGGGFTLGIESLRRLSAAAVNGQALEPVRKDNQPPIATRADAQAAIAAVERFLSAAEPSSPVPLLLGKARSLLNKEFSAILNEMNPPAATPAP